MVVDARIYMTASDYTLSTHRRAWQEGRDEAWVSDDDDDEKAVADKDETCKRRSLSYEEICKRRSMSYEDLGPFCSSSFRVRLDSYNEIAEQHDNDSRHPIHLINLQQTAEYMGATPKLVVPSLLSNSFLYDRKSKKEIIPAQHLLMMGWPVPAWSPPHLASLFPFPQLIDIDHTEDASKLSANQIRSLTGKAWHWSCFSAMLLFLLSTSRVQQVVATKKQTIKQIIIITTEYRWTQQDLRRQGLEAFILPRGHTSVGNALPATVHM